MINQLKKKLSGERSRVTNATSRHAGTVCKMLDLTGLLISKGAYIKPPGKTIKDSLG